MLSRRRQLALKFPPSHGGKRKNAGRKPKGERSGVSHRPRARFDRLSVLHVTLTVANAVWNLRSGRMFRAMRAALSLGADTLGVRLIHFAIQGNHIHLIFEARSHEALATAVKALCVRVARRLNRRMGRSGAVFADRYHSRILRTPTEVHRALAYVRNNHRAHMAQVGRRLQQTFVDPYSSFAPGHGVALPDPQSWFLKIGWTALSRLVRPKATANRTQNSP